MFIVGGGGGGTPGGSNKQVQFNDSAAFGGAVGFTWDKATGAVSNLGAGAISTNQAFGTGALIANTSGKANSAFGYKALASNTDGGTNSSFGYNALTTTNHSGSNSAFGYAALKNNNSVTGANCAFGANAGLNVSSGGSNSFFGYAAGKLLTSSNNAGFGRQALIQASGSNNCGFGYKSGYGITTGSSCTFIGYKADTNVVSVTNSTALGASATVTASHQIMLGTSSETVQFPGGFASPNNSPASISGNTNDYSPGAGLFQRWASTGSFNVTGMVAGIDGERRTIINVGSNNITLTNQDTNSAAANRWLTSTGANITLGANGATTVIYDTTTARWRAF